MATKFLIPITVWSLLLSSCSISRQQMSSFSDDVYSSPSELKAIARAKALAQAKQDSIAKQVLADSAVAQTARDNANPYYQDPTYNKDDYYDYEYASRINRFNNPIAGAGYYDNYYTNMYTYNQNPACYGTSIYSSYNYMPSTQFAMMSSGIGMGFGNSFYNGYNMGYGNMGYNNFGYGMGFGVGYGNPYGMGYSTYPYYSNSFGYYNYNPYYNTGFYNGYNMGYYNGYYNNYYNSGWGYLNTYDPNSAYASMDYAPRTSGNTNGGARVVTGGTQTQGNDGRQQLYNAYVQQQNNTPRFSNSASRSTNINNATFNQSRTNGFQNTNLNNGGNRATQGQTQTNYGSSNNPTRVNNGGNRASMYDNNNGNNNPTGRSTNENNGWNQNNGGWNNESGRSSGGFNGGGGGFSPRGGGGGGGRGGR